MSRDPLVAELLELLGDQLDGRTVKRRLARHFDAPKPAPAPAPVPVAAPAGGLSEAAQRLQTRIGLADILDESILHARSNDRTFPLRLFFGELVTSCDEDDVAFALASGLNLFFRHTMTEEPSMHVAVEISRLYYAYAQKRLDADLVPRLSPLLAQLMSTQLDQLKLEAVDHIKIFDSGVHERAPRADRTKSTVVRPLTFLCKIAVSSRPRLKAVVLT